MPHPLDHAPPRLSDVRGNALRTALLARHDAERDRWWNERRRIPLARRAGIWIGVAIDQLFGRRS